MLWRQNYVYVAFFSAFCDTGYYILKILKGGNSYTLSVASLRELGIHYLHHIEIQKGYSFWSMGLHRAYLKGYPFGPNFCNVIVMDIPF